MTFNVASISAYIIGVFFIVSGLIELSRWKSFVPPFIKWGYPRYWPIVTFALKVLGGAFVFLPETRQIGLALCALIAIAGAATILYHKEQPAYKRVLPLAAIIVMLSAIGWPA